MFQNIRKASPKKKNVFALVISGGITLVIFVLWAMFSLPNLMNREEEPQKAPSVLAVLRSQISSLPASVAGAIENLGTSVNSSDILDTKLQYQSE